MPVVRSVPDMTALSESPSNALIRGNTSSASMPRISRGTPGIIATQCPFSSSSQIPGAEPWRLVSIPAPSGISAWLLFVAGNVPPGNRARQRSSSAAAISSSSTIFRPKIFAMDGLVRSSLVGPRPPVVITAPVRSSASRTADAILSASSPTVVRRTISTPASARVRAMCAALVSIVKPRRSSSPIVISSTRKPLKWRALRNTGAGKARENRQ